MTDEDLDIEMPEDKPGLPPVDPADLPEITNVEPIDTVSAPKD